MSIIVKHEVCCYEPKPKVDTQTEGLIIVHMMQNSIILIIIILLM